MRHQNHHPPAPGRQLHHAAETNAIANTVSRAITKLQLAYQDLQFLRLQEHIPGLEHPMALILTAIDEAGRIRDSLRAQALGSANAEADSQIPLL